MTGIVISRDDALAILRVLGVDTSQSFHTVIDMGISQAVVTVEQWATNDDGKRIVDDAGTENAHVRSETLQYVVGIAGE